MGLTLKCNRYSLDYAHIVFWITTVTYAGSIMVVARQLPPNLDLSTIPLQAPPPGVVPNFINPPSASAEVFAVSTVLIFLSTLFLVLRLYSRLLIARGFGVDDGETSKPLLLLVSALTFLGLLLGGYVCQSLRKWPGSR